MTVGEVSQAITDATNGKILGSIMKIGGEKPYQLMINSKDTGENNRIYFGTGTPAAAVAFTALPDTLTLRPRNVE